MEDKFKTSSQLDAEYGERLKRDYIESTLSLVESFARQAARYAEQGDEQAALKARSNFESFCHLALEMIQRLQDRQNAAVFMAKLRLVGCDPERSRCVA
jgi:hypothetical protein